METKIKAGVIAAIEELLYDTSSVKNKLTTNLRDEYCKIVKDSNIDLSKNIVELTIENPILQSQHDGTIVVNVFAKIRTTSVDTTE